MEEKQIKVDVLEDAKTRDVRNDIETPEYKMLSDTLDKIEEEDYLDTFLEATDYTTFEDKCYSYEKKMDDEKNKSGK
ncbi:MAG: hypothetical protein KH135_03095 [Firmicutes bacterium]|nr:hypothetical protein [Bacillota bacterium]